MWITEEVIDDKDLEKMYFEEIASVKSRGARMTRDNVNRGRKRRKGLNGGIIDLSISDAGEDEDQMDPVDSGRTTSKLSQSDPGRSVGSPSVSSTNSSTFIPQPHSSQHNPTKRRLAISAVEVKSVPELRGVFVSSIHESSALADMSVGDEGRQVDSMCHAEALLVI